VAGCPKVEDGFETKDEISSRMAKVDEVLNAIIK
jgi:hypothetical protein